MNIQEIATWLHKPQTLDSNSINQLEALVEEYPFFNGARILLARAAKNQEDHRFGRFLKTAALYAGDRKRLFHYLETDPSAMEQEDTHTHAQGISTENISETFENPETEVTAETPAENQLPPALDIAAEKVESPHIEEEQNEKEAGLREEPEEITARPLSVKQENHTEKDTTEFVLRNLDDWDDIIYEEHSEHIPGKTARQNGREQESFEQLKEEIQEPEIHIGNLKDIPPDESFDSSKAGSDTKADEFDSGEEKALKEQGADSHNKLQMQDEEKENSYGRDELEQKLDEPANEVSGTENRDIPADAGTAVWENESFPEEVALSASTGLDPAKEEPVPIKPEAGGKYRFEEWLSALQMLSRIEKKEAEEKVAADKKIEEPEKEKETLSESQEIDPRAGSRDIIEKFLKEEPSISKPHAEFYKPRNMARQSEQFHEDEWATETLARIYAKQGHSDRAIRIYQKLILQMPDKKAYFASLIEELNKKR